MHTQQIVEEPGGRPMVGALRPSVAAHLVALSVDDAELAARLVGRPDAGAYRQVQCPVCARLLPEYLVVDLPTWACVPGVYEVCGVCLGPIADTWERLCADWRRANPFQASAVPATIAALRDDLRAWLTREVDRQATARAAATPAGDPTESDV